MSEEQLGDLGGAALIKFMQTLPQEDVKLLATMPAGLVAKVFQAGCVFGIDMAIETTAPSKPSKGGGE